MLYTQWLNNSGCCGWYCVVNKSGWWVVLFVNKPMWVPYGPIPPWTEWVYMVSSHPWRKTLVTKATTSSFYIFFVMHWYIWTLEVCCLIVLVYNDVHVSFSNIITNIHRSVSVTVSNLRGHVTKTAFHISLCHIKQH